MPGHALWVYKKLEAYFSPFLVSCTVGYTMEMTRIDTFFGVTKKPKKS